MIKRNSVFLAVLCLSGATNTLAFTTGSDRPAEVRPGQSGTLPPPNTSSPETTLGTLETGEATLEDDWFNTVLQKLPTVDDSARREIVLNRDKNGCYLPQNMLGAPSKKAPTVPPPPSTAPPQDKPSGTIEY